MSAQLSETDVLDALRANHEAYCSDALVIRTKSAHQIPFVWNTAQHIVAALTAQQMREKGYVREIILKARQEGISTWVASRNFRRVHLYPNQRALVIADQRKRGEVLFGIYELFDQRLPEWMAPAKRWQRKGLTLHYDLPAGGGLNSMIVVETAKDAAAGRGSTIQAVHASELAFWENPEVAWTALMQAVPDDGSEVIVESTANGVGNMFHQMWLDAEAGDSTFMPIFLPWWIHEEYVRPIPPTEREDLLESLNEWEREALEHGFEWRTPDDIVPAVLPSGAAYTEGRWRLTLEQLAWRRGAIRDKLNGDENLFRQEYPSTAREAFLVSGNCFFDEEALLDYENRVKVPKRYEISMRGQAVIRRPAARGSLKIWADPRVFDEAKPKDESNEDGEYVIFADTATGKMSSERESIYASDREQGGRDFSAAWVYDVRRGVYVALLHGRMPPEIFADKLYALGYLYANRNKRTGNRIPALLGVERNHSSGETVVRRLNDDLDYPNLFRDRVMNTRRNKMTISIGWVTTEAKRTVMLDEFGAELRERAVVLPDADTIRECFTFIRAENGKPEAQEGCHDDRVIAAAGCIQMARHHRVPAIPFERTAIRRGGGAGHLEFEEAQDARS